MQEVKKQANPERGLERVPRRQEPMPSHNMFPSMWGGPLSGVAKEPETGARRQKTRARIQGCFSAQKTEPQNTLVSNSRTGIRPQNRGKPSTSRSRFGVAVVFLCRVGHRPLAARRARPATLMVRLFLQLPHQGGPFVSCSWRRVDLPSFPERLQPFIF